MANGTERETGRETDEPLVHVRRAIEVATATDRDEEAAVLHDALDEILRLRADETDGDGTGDETTHVRVSDTELLDEIQAAAGALGRAPTSLEMGEHGAYSVRTYVNHFGTWNDAVETAGLEPAHPSTPRYSRDELLDELRDLAADLGRAPVTSDMRDGDRTSAATFDHRFGSWTDALREAGVIGGDGDGG